MQFVTWQPGSRFYSTSVGFASRGDDQIVLQSDNWTATLTRRDDGLFFGDVAPAYVDAHIEWNDYSDLLAPDGPETYSGYLIEPAITNKGTHDITGTYLLILTDPV